MRLTSLICILLLAGNQLFAQQKQDTQLVISRIDTTFKIKSHSGADTLIQFAQSPMYTKSDINKLYNRYQRLVGLTAPDFKLEDLNGKKVSLHDFSGKTVLLDFWFTNCGPCLLDMKYAKPIHDFYKNDSSVAIISICIDEKQNRSNWKKIVKERAIPGIHLFMNDEDKNTNNAYYYQEVATAFPTHTIVSKEQKFLGIAPRYSDINQLYTLTNAINNVSTADSFLQAIYHDKNYMRFICEDYLRFYDYCDQIMTLHQK